jgi:hypothetical protein
MRDYLLSTVSDPELLHATSASVKSESAATAWTLAHIAAIDARRLFVPAGYPSIYLYCMRELHLSESSTWKRIQAGRKAREFPIIFEMLADGRLHLAAVCLLAPYVTRGNADTLLNAATHRSKSEIEKILAARFPRSEMLPLVQRVPATAFSEGGPAPGQVQPDRNPEGEPTTTRSWSRSGGEHASEQGEGDEARLPAPSFSDDAVSRGEHAPQHVHVPAQATRQAGASPPPLLPPMTPPGMAHVRMKPIARDRFHVDLTMGQSLHDKIRQAQDLLSHRVPSGDIAEVLELALDALIPKLERERFAATDRPRANGQAPKSGGRHIPATVKRAVRQRDGDQCAFVSRSGQRCPSRRFLQFDHIVPFARGGEATVDNIRLVCSAHNRHAAECAFGAEFIDEKRRAARAAAGRCTPETASGSEPPRDRDPSPGPHPSTGG